MPDIPRREPESIAIGDTLIFERYLRAYPASQGWSLAYTLYTSKGLPLANFTSTPATDNPDAHSINVADFADGSDPGPCVLAGYAVNAGPPAVRHQMYDGELNLLPNLADGAQQADLETFDQRMIRKIECQIEQMAEHVVDLTNIQQVEIQRVKRTELEKQLQYHRERDLNYQRIQRMKNGQGNSSQITPIFQVPG